MNDSKNMIMSLAQKNILLIIGGGIAAYKALDLIRRLRERGAKVRVVLTRDGQKFVTPLTAAALSGQPAFCDLFAGKEGYDIGHIRLAREADLLLIAPLTASRMAKMATGLADDLAGAVMLAASCPILAAPAMNPHMWAHATTRRNLAQLRDDGINFVDPEWGEMAETGESGLGRMSEVTHIVTQVEQILTRPQDKQPKDRLLENMPLKNHHVIVTAGPTHELIDPVRYIANRSSGKQGYAIADALAKLGAQVTLISGPVALAPPIGVRMIYVDTACAMLVAVEEALPADAAVFVAAVADWRLANPQSQKMKKRKGQHSLTLEFTQNPDILAKIAKSVNRPQLVIGFAAETSDLLANGRKKLHDKGADWIIANDVSSASDGSSIMGGDYMRAHILSNESCEEWPEMSKQEMANLLAQKIAHHLAETSLDRSG